MNLLFELANLSVMPFWLAMILAPRQRLTQRLMARPWPAAVLAVVYATVLAPLLPSLLPLLARPRLAEIAAALGTPAGATLGWLHFLAFDLLVGRWVHADSLERDLPWWRTAPVLFLTLMFGPLGWLTHLLTRDLRRPLQGLTRLSLLGMLVSLGGLWLDPRLITGAPAWAKPLKFFVSTVFYAATLDRVLAFLPSALARRVERVTTACLALELVLIVVQVERGTSSHFNQASAFDAVVFGVMGLAIFLVWLACLAVALWARPEDPWLRVGLRWGAGLTFGGMGVGWLMAIWLRHTVGAPDGGPGLPILNWSLHHGDLRVPHFLGMHALQVLPLASLVLKERTPVLGWGYLGLIGLTLGQAVRDQSVTAPDGWTWALLLALGFTCWRGLTRRVESASPDAPPRRG